MEYLVSVIIPVYKVEQYIERCLLSVMNQRCLDILVECILVDDCSPDKSMCIAEKLINDYCGNVQFAIARHDQNMGLSAARNTGMNLAKGEYLLFLDSDDYITDDCIHKLTEVLKEYPEMEVVKGNHEGRVNIRQALIPHGPIGNDTLLDLLYTGAIPVMAWNTLIKRTLVEKFGLSFKAGLLQEDILWTFQLYRHVDSFVFIPDVTYYYENNPNSILGDNNDLCQARYLPHRIIIIDELLSSFNTKHIVPYTCYIISGLLQMYDSYNKSGHLNKGVIMRIHQLRNRLVKHTFLHFRYMLLFYELMLFMPFRLLMKVRFFRHNYYRLEMTIIKMSSVSK